MDKNTKETLLGIFNEVSQLSVSGFDVDRVFAIKQTLQNLINQPIKEEKDDKKSK